MVRKQSMLTHTSHVHMFTLVTEVKGD